MKKTAIILSLALCLSGKARAQKQTLTVDAGQSQVNFSLGGNTHHVNGLFHVKSGSVDFDATAGQISGLVVVAAGSGDSGDKGRDKKMNSDVLESEKFAEISFAPKSYQGKLAASGDSTIQVSGTFTLHGGAHEITVPLKVHIEGGAATAKGKFTVPYVQWGLKDPSILILKVAKEVEVDLTLAGKLSK